MTDLINPAYTEMLDFDLDAPLPEAPKQTRPMPTYPATERQIAFMRTLAAERNYELDNDEIPYMDKRDASRMIDTLLGMPKAQRSRGTADAPEGMHRLDDVIYKVQIAVHGSGKPYAKKLVLTEPDCGGCANGEPEGCIDTFGQACTPSVTFDYAPGAVYNLSKETLLTLDEAKEFGALYGTCVVCGRTLTNEASIEAGLGPVCAARF